MTAKRRARLRELDQRFARALAHFGLKPSRKALARRRRRERERYIRATSGIDTHELGLAGISAAMVARMLAERDAEVANGT